MGLHDYIELGHADLLIAYQLNLEIGHIDLLVSLETAHLYGAKKCSKPWE